MAISRLFRLPWPQIGLVIALGLGLYVSTLRAPMTFDDETFIMNNRFVTEPGLLRGIPEPDAENVSRTRYLAYLSFRMNYIAGGISPTGYHVLNIAVHMLSAILVFCLVRLLMETPVLRRNHRLPETLPLLCAVFFLIHPLQTGAVTYIVQRFASMATMFYLAAIASYLRSRIAGSKPAYAASIACALMGTLTKEIAFTLPLALILTETFFFAAPVRHRALALAPFFLIALLIPLSHAGTSGSLLDMALPSETYSRADYLVTQLGVVATYLRMIVFPFNQVVDHDYKLLASMSSPRAITGLILILSLIGLAIAGYRRGTATARIAGFGIMWFFLTLSIESSVIPMGDLMFEHRLYLPMFGASMTIATGACLAHARFMQHPLKIAFVSMLIMLCLLTLKRNATWGNEIALWQDAALKSPNKARVHYNLATAYKNTGNVGHTVEHYLAAISHKPDYADAHYNLANVLVRAGRPGEARKFFVSAINAKPEMHEAYANLGYLAMAEGRYDLAQENYAHALSIMPGIAAYHFNLGTACLAKGDKECARLRFTDALRLDPEFQPAIERMQALTR